MYHIFLHVFRCQIDKEIKQKHHVLLKFTDVQLKYNIHMYHLFLHVFCCQIDKEKKEEKSCFIWKSPSGATKLFKWTKMFWLLAQGRPV